ncbi:MAG: hypothetical protein JNL82_26930 [Myxococcales bacterium]|nr:hypothetical protein [Myxococcales bacterium]
MRRFWSVAARVRAGRVTRVGGDIGRGDRAHNDGDGADDRRTGRVMCPDGSTSDAPDGWGECFGRARVDCGKLLPDGVEGWCQLKQGWRYPTCTTGSCAAGEPVEVCVWMKDFEETGCDCFWWWRIGADGTYVLDPANGETRFEFPVDWSRCSDAVSMCGCLEVSPLCK